MKTCLNCGLIAPLECFYKKPFFKDGRDTLCSTCRSEKTRSKHEENNYIKSITPPPKKKVKPAPKVKLDARIEARILLFSLPLCKDSQNLKLKWMLENRLRLKELLKEISAR